MLDEKSLTNNLENLGLSTKEAKIYLAALSEPATILELAKKTKIKRPTVYVVIDSLKKKKLISDTRINNKIVFYAAPPSLIKQKALDQLNATQTILPQLEFLRSNQSGRPEISAYEGYQGVEKIYRELVSQDEVWFWSSIEDVQESYPKVLNLLSDKIKSGSVKVKEILTGSLRASRYAKQYVKLQNYEVRVNRDRPFFGDCFLYGDVIGIVSLEKNNLFIVKIENYKMSQTFKSLFLLAWKSARKV